MRRALESFAKKFGVSLVPDWRVIRLDEERHLTRLLRYLDVDCVLDVGANVGQFAEMLRKHAGYKGHIVSYEPNPAAFRQLQDRSKKDAKWRVIPMALGSQKGTFSFNAVDQSLLGSFKGFSDSPHAPASSSSVTVDVETSTVEEQLPNLIAELGCRNPFLKMDTQGFDLEVLKGAGDSLSKFVGVMSEIAFQTIYRDAPKFSEIFEYLDRAGFVLSRLTNTHEIHFPELVEMDAFFLRRDLLKKASP